MKNQREYMRWANEQVNLLLSQPFPENQKEKDVWNLKMFLYGIKPYSINWGLGMVSTIRRCIAKMEKEKAHENNG
ncbi:hypothetical protein FACS189444_4130 [Spirochaetia bacterium]|nr:hypothetical protein FACS189444_4130 [Spirochaetia bacterium]